MREIIRIIVLMLIASPMLPAQDLPAETYAIRGSIEKAGGLIYLADFEGDRFNLRDSIHSHSGSFYFLLDGTAPPGVYRILFSQVEDGVFIGNRFIEFIFNREELEIYVEQGEKGLVPVFVDSPENSVYSGFMEFEIGYEEKIMELYPDLSDPAATGRYDALQRQRSTYIDSITSAHPDLYATRIIRALRSPFVPGSLSHRQRIDTLRVCFFNHAAIDDPVLMHVPVYTFRILEFLSLYRDDIPREKQQELYLKAVDRIMVNTSMDPELRSFVVDLLLEGFGMLGMDRVQVHLADHYLDETCPSDTGAVVRSRMACFSKMARGTKAPDFVIRDLEGVNHHLAELEHPFVLVLFWSARCEHCRKLMAELHEWYLNGNDAGIEIIAISLDSEEAGETEYEGAREARDFQNTSARELPGSSPLDLQNTSALEPHSLPAQEPSGLSAQAPHSLPAQDGPWSSLQEFQWISARDPLGWIGKIPTDYCIYATPAMFLLDHDRTILAKPGNFRQFLREVKRAE